LLWEKEDEVNLFLEIVEMFEENDTAGKIALKGLDYKEQNSH